MLHFWLVYIDPGSGSMLVQLLIGGVLSFLMFFKQLKFKFLQFFGRKTTDDPEE